MPLNKKQLNELDIILREDYGKKLSQSDLFEFGNSLISYFELLSKIYLRNKIKDKICDCCEKCFGERKEDEVGEFSEIRNSVAHGFKDVSDPEEIKIMIEKTPQIKDLARRFLNFWSKKIDMIRKGKID